MGGWHLSCHVLSLNRRLLCYTLFLTDTRTIMIINDSISVNAVYVRSLIFYPTAVSKWLSTCCSQQHLSATYVTGREGAGLCGVPGEGVSVEAGVVVGVVGEGWKVVAIGDVEDRRGSLGPAGERVPPLLDSALTFCSDIKQTSSRNDVLQQVLLISSKVLYR